MYNSQIPGQTIFQLRSLNDAPKAPIPNQEIDASKEESKTEKSSPVLTETIMAPINTLMQLVYNNLPFLIKFVFKIFYDIFQTFFPTLFAN